MPERWAGISEEGTTGANISDWGIAEINSTVLFSPHKYASCEVVIFRKLLSSAETSVIVLDSAASWLPPRCDDSAAYFGPHLPRRL